MNTPDLEKFQPERIGVLIFRQIGDVLLATPALTELRQRYPKARITVLVNDTTAPILQNNPDVDELVIYQRNLRRESMWKRLAHECHLVRTIRRARFDLVIDLTGGDRPAAYSWLSRARARISFTPRAKVRNFLKRAAYTHPVTRPPATLHTCERHMQLLAPLGIRPAVLPPLRYEPTAQEIDWARQQAQVGKRPIIAAHFVANWLFKCWEDKKAAALLDRLQEELGATIWFTSGPEPREIERSKNILALCRKAPRTWLGDISLRQLGALLHEADCFVGVDTAPMHLAAAVGIPTVALFGPTVAELWRPWSSTSVVLQGRCHCREEGRQTCVHNDIRDCLREISVDAVFKAVTAVLAARGLAAH